MASPNEIWTIDFGDPYPGEPAHHRPALVIGPSALFGDALPFVIVAPMTTVRRGLSLHVEVDPDETNGLNHTSYIQCELIRSINGNRLVRRLGTAGTTASLQVELVVKALLGY